MPVSRLREDHQHRDGHDQGHRLQTAEQLEEPVEERTLIIDLLDSGAADEC